jgi:hypothetical protein
LARSSSPLDDDDDDEVPLLEDDDEDVEDEDELLELDDGGSPPFPFLPRIPICGAPGVVDRALNAAEGGIYEALTVWDGGSMGKSSGFCESALLLDECAARLS